MLQASPRLRRHIGRGTIMIKQIDEPPEAIAPDTMVVADCDYSLHIVNSWGSGAPTILGLEASPKPGG